MPPQGERKYAIVGLGQVCGPQPGRTPRSVQCESAWMAIEDAGLKREDIDGAVEGRSGGGAGDAATWVDPYPRVMGLPINFYFGVGRGGAIAGLGIATALSFLDRGISNYVMVSTVVLDLTRKYATRETQSGRPTIGTAGHGGREGYWGSPHGDVAAAAHHSWIAARHMAVFGSTEEQRGHIAVQTRAWANKNPDAKMYGRPMTMEDYLHSPWAARPYRLLDICLVSDNATSFIITTADRAKDTRKPVWILGQGFGEAIEDSWWEKENYIRLPVARAKEKAFGQSGISKIEEIDSVQFYDCFTGEVMFQIEDYGYAPKGQGGAWAAEGHMGPGGDHPINTSGGLLSAYHNSDNTGLAEAVRQVRGEAGERQIANCQTALSTGHGGEMLSPALCSTHTTTILGRD